MSKSLSLFALALLLVGGAASAAPTPPAAPAASAPALLAGLEAAQAPPVQECAAQDWLSQIQKEGVPICQGNGCDKTADCRPVGLPECAQCFCVGPAGDKSCACI